MGAFIRNNKLNDIKYYIDYTVTLYKFLYNNIELTIHDDIKNFIIYNNEGKLIYKIKYKIKYKKDFLTYYKNYNDGIKYNFYNNYIVITKGEYPFYQTIYYNTKNLKIFRIYKYYEDIEEIHEKRNNNNEIIYCNEYINKGVMKENLLSNDENPPFSKPLRKFYIELIDYYKKNINNCIKIIKIYLKKKKYMINYH